MSTVAARLAIPDGQFSVAAAGVWSMQPVRPELREGLGCYLLHIPSGIQMNVRGLSSHGVLSGADLAAPSALEDTFRWYSDLSWPGRRTARLWTKGVLRGVTGVFEEAMPDGVVREWLVTDGTRLANAATFATRRQWEEILEDCDRVVRSIRFEGAVSVG
jgi:hypothetical protein